MKLVLTKEQTIFLSSKSWSFFLEIILPSTLIFAFVPVYSIVATKNNSLELVVADGDVLLLTFFIWLSLIVDSIIVKLRYKPSSSYKSSILVGLSIAIALLNIIFYVSVKYIAGVEHDLWWSPARDSSREIIVYLSLTMAIFTAVMFIIVGIILYSECFSSDWDRK